MTGQRTTSRRVVISILAASVGLLTVLPSGARADDPLTYRTAVVRAENGYSASWSGTVPAMAGVACLPADPRCDHTLVEVLDFEGDDVPCVGVAATIAGGPTRAHIAVYRALPGLPPTGEAVATSDDGTLLFIGEPGAIYDVAIGRAGLPIAVDQPYSAQVATRDIGFGPGPTGDLDLLMCAPALWAADTGIGAAKAAFDEFAARS